EVPEEFTARLNGRDARDPLQTQPALLDQRLGLLLAIRQDGFASLHASLPIVDLLLLLAQELDPPLQVPLLLLEAILELLQLLALRAGLALELRLGGALPLLALDLGLLQPDLGTALRLLDDGPGALAGPRQGTTGRDPQAVDEARERGREENDDEKRLQHGPLLRRPEAGARIIAGGRRGEDRVGKAGSALTAVGPDAQNPR